jgi:hypothetical protein
MKVLILAFILFLLLGIAFHYVIFYSLMGLATDSFASFQKDGSNYLK